jgi:hypothetical protein
MTRAYVYWISAQAILLVAGFAGALISLLITTASGWSRVTIAILSVLASFAGTVLTQLRLYELWRLREDIEPSYQLLVDEARRRTPSCLSDAACDAVYKDISEKRAALKSPTVTVGLAY